MKNNFLLIKIPFISLPPYLPTSPQIKFSGENETALRGQGDLGGGNLGACDRIIFYSD
jgi:hypothetical protein